MEKAKADFDANLK